MTEGARHADDRSHFARDLIIWIVGVAFFGALTFGLLAFFADGSTVAEPGGDTTTSSTTTTVDNTTTTTVDNTTTTTVDNTTTTVPIRPPGEVRVQVLNFPGGIPGAALRLTQRLSQEGYLIVPPTDYRDNDRSRIWYRDGFAAEAEVLLAFVPGGLVEALPDTSLTPTANIIIFLGPDYEE